MTQIKTHNGSEFAATKAQARYAILSTQWNSFITDNLLRSAIAALTRNKVPEENIEVIMVPGAFELPVAAQHALATDRFDALIALGCVIRGGTPHFDFVCSGCMDGLMNVQLDAQIPVTFGVLTVDDIQQAEERSADDPNNKGEEAALTALDMVATLASIHQL